MFKRNILCLLLAAALLVQPISLRTWADKVTQQEETITEEPTEAQKTEEIIEEPEETRESAEESEPEETLPEETEDWQEPEEDYEEDYEEVNEEVYEEGPFFPDYTLEEYGDVLYGSGTIKTNGCSVCCMAVAATYLTGHQYYPDELARWFGSKAENNVDRLRYMANALHLYYSSYHHFGVTVLRKNFVDNNMTLESLVYGLVIGLRFATVCMWLESMFQVVSSDKVVYLFGKISPLLSLFLTILLRLIPRIGLEARRINLAQKGIGKGSNQGTIFQRIVNCLRIFSMLITWMISALGLESDSMRSRGSLLRGRTAFSIYRFDNRDRAFVIGLFACITLTVMGVILGASKMWYNPRIIWRPLNALGVLTALGYTKETKV